MTVKATDDSYGKALQSMAQAEEETRSRGAIVIKHGGRIPSRKYRQHTHSHMHKGLKTNLYCIVLIISKIAILYLVAIATCVVTSDNKSLVFSFCVYFTVSKLSIHYTCYTYEVFDIVHIVIVYLFFSIFFNFFEGCWDSAHPQAYLLTLTLSWKCTTNSPKICIHMIKLVIERFFCHYCLSTSNHQTTSF